MTRIAWWLACGAAVSAMSMASDAVAGKAPPLATQVGRTDPEQVIRIDVRGAVAEVTVTRTLRHCDGLPWTEARTRGECVLDITLPRGAALLAVELRDGGAIAGAAPSAALENYRDALRAAHVEPSAIPFDDDARYRVRVLDPTTDRNRAVVLRYSFAAPVEIAGNVAFLSFPPSAELAPPEARVEVLARTVWLVTAISIAGQTAAVVHGAHGAHGASDATSTGAASTRTSWRVDLTLGTPPGADPSGGVVVLASRSSASSEKRPARMAIAVGVRSAGAGIDALPDRALFVIDRSRSVGPGGLEAERDLALQLLRRLPPSTRFDAVFFDRHTRRLFPVARTATRQAIAALADEMVPDRLANGTELAAAIAYATDLLRREALDFGPRVLLAVLTDGAVGAAARDAEPWSSSFKPPLPELYIAVLSIRPNDDPAVSTEERAHLRTLATRATRAGLEMAMHTGELSESLDSALDGLRSGGSVFALSVTASDSRARALTTDIAAGQGFTTLLDLGEPAAAAKPSVEMEKPSGARSSHVPRQEPIAIHFQYRAAKMSAAARATPVPERLLSALFEVRAPHAGVVAARDAIRSWVTPRLAALWEPVIRPPARPSPDEADAHSAGPRGFMERSVVRDALSIAYTPRARGCYLSRSARTPADRELEGRVRIALDMLRGEVVAARILSSTLAHSVIESCLREAAFALDIPRAYRNDDPVTAVLNLVFRPRTAEYRRPVERTEFDRELELVIERAAETPAHDAGVKPDGDASF